jgi:anaerobic selenocysteine-containing dehydrogenase
MTREALSFCRICPGYCGLILTIDDSEHIIGVRGDKAHPMSQGYTCIKGVQSAHLYHGQQRLLYPLKRQPDGRYARIPLEQALDEIAEKLRTIIGRDGPDAVGLFKGGNVYQNTLPSTFLSALQTAIGTSSLFTNNTIDQSAKAVSADRLGSWNAGKNYLAAADALMIFGGNPLVAIAAFGFDAYNPLKKLKEFKARGSKLIIIDPRRTETARYADFFLQPRPGEDVTIAAAMIRLILSEGWEDRDFCTRYVDRLDSLRAAIEPFTVEYAARRADIDAQVLRRATECFAKSSHGFATTATGTCMAPRSNLSQHLVDCMDVVCGHFLRPGDRVPNPGLRLKRSWHAEVVPPGRCWEKGPKSRVRGLGLLYGEKMTGALAQEITTPGPGQIKALIVDGGNPASSISDQRRIVSAMQSLELLVTIDPEMTATARLAHYVLPPKLQFEHPNMVGLLDYETAFHQRPVQQFVTAAIACPPDSELTDDWYVYWALAKRLGKSIIFDGIELDMERKPDPEDLFRLLFRNGNASFDEIKQHPRGHIFDIETYVEPARPGAIGKFQVAPVDVEAEIAKVAREDFGAQRYAPNGQPFDLLLISRRMREVFNSAGRTSPEIRKRRPYNPAYLHPDELAAHGLCEGDRVDITSDNGTIPAIIAADGDLRRGVVSMAHGWGGLPGEELPYESEGASTGLLVSTERDYETINAMPRQSAIPIYLRKSFAKHPMGGGVVSIA